MNTKCLAPMLGALVIGGGLLTGCTSLPSLPDETRIPVSAVVDRVQCEIRDAINANIPDYPWFKNWAGGFALTLKVEEVVGADATAGWVVPWSPPNGLTLGLSTGASHDTTRTAIVKYILPVKDFAQYRCVQPPSYGPGTHPFLGSLGLTEWLSRVLRSSNSNDVAKQPSEIDYTLNFAVALNAKFSPGITLINLTAGADASANRTDTHTLDLAFTDASPSNPQKVFVVNWPSLAAVPNAGSGVPPAPAPVPGGQVAPHTYHVIPGTYPFKGTGSKGVDPDIKRRIDQILDNLQLRSLLR